MNINLKQIKTIRKNEGALCVIKFLWAKLIISHFLFKIPGLRLNNIHSILITCANRVINTQFLAEQKLAIKLLSNFGLGVKFLSFGN